MSNTKSNNGQHNRVAITGMGVISSIGYNQVENLNALLTSRTGISTIDILETKHKNFKVGEIKLTNTQLNQNLKLPKDNNYTRTASLGCIAAQEALQQAKIADISEYPTALISATSVGGMDMTEKYFKKFAKQREFQKYIGTHNASDSTKKIASYLKINGFVTTISTACSSAANAIMLGARLIKSGYVDRAIVGGTDALSKFTLNGFNSLMILSDDMCAPFDENRKGLNLGEGAGYLVLEAQAVIEKENKNPMAYLAGYGNANDAFHQTASSTNGDGAYLAMYQALKTAGLFATEIDYINAHGTATPNNDLSESVALKRIFHHNVPSFSSTKPFTGHTLASAGALEAVFSILSLQGQVVFPNLNFTEPIAQTGLNPTTQLKPTKIEHVLSNSFGFGGNCSSLIFSKP